MTDPFTLLDRFRPRAEGHKVTLDNVLGAVAVQPSRQRTRPVVDRTFVDKRGRHAGDRRGCGRGGRCRGGRL